MQVRNGILAGQLPVVQTRKSQPSNPSGCSVGIAGWLALRSLSATLVPSRRALVHARAEIGCS